MELFLQQIEEANKAMKLADHLIYVTFPLLSDEKIMAMIVNNLYNSLIKTIDSLLSYEKYYKRIDTVPEDFDNKIYVFKTEISKRYNLNHEIILVLKDLREVVETRKRVNAEFFKKNNLVLLTNEFKIKTLNLKKVKEYVNSAKLFIGRVNTIIGNARRF